MSEPLFQQALKLQRGSYLVINTDGTHRFVLAKPTIENIQVILSTRLRECVCLDTVILRMGGNGGQKDPIVMMVDDTGMIDGLPVNTSATELIRSVKKYKYDIHGIVVVVNDADFGEPLPARFNR